MEITEQQYARIKDSLPVQRGNVSLTSLQVLNAILYVAEQGCKWRGLPKQIVLIRIEAFSLDSTSMKVHPDGTGALKETDHKPLENPAADGTPRFIWLPRMLERL